MILLCGSREREERTAASVCIAKQAGITKMRWCTLCAAVLLTDPIGIDAYHVALRSPPVPHFRTFARTPAARAQFSMPNPFEGGMDKRSQRRFTEMKRADEPLVEELRGLSVLGIFGGFFLLPVIGISPWLGMLLGWQFAPLLAIAEGSVGESCRKAGWEANLRCKAIKDRAIKEWETADAKWDLRGRWVAFDARGKWAAFSAEYDVPGRVATLMALFVAKVWEPLKRLVAQLLERLEERGLVTKTRALWVQTGIPAWYAKQVEAWRDNQVLRARMRQVEARENGGFNL